MKQNIPSDRHVLALSAAGMGVWEWNIVTNELTWDESLFVLYGVDPKSFTGTVETWRTCLHPDDAKKAQDDLQISVNTHEPFRSTFRIKRPLDGKVLFVGAAGRVICDESNRPARMVGVNWDCTEQVKMERDVVRTRDFVDGILNSISDPIFVKNPAHEWIYFNQAFCAMMGKSPDALLGRTDYDIFPREMADHFWRVDDEAFRERREVDLEEPILIEEKIRFLHTKKNPIFGADDKPQMLVGVIRDITERRRSEEEMRNLQKLVESSHNSQINSQRVLMEQSKMAALGQLAGGIAHEINNPLAAVRGRLYILQLGLEAATKLPPNELLNEIQTIDRLTIRISEIINALKVFSRKDTDSQLISLSLLDVVKEVANVSVDKIRKCDCVLEIEVDPSLQILGRRVDLMQILMNLINNSCDAVENLPERWVRVEASITDDGVALKVTDSGAGIPDEIAKRMMEPFFTTKEVGRGTGLGLSISRSLAENMRGSLTLDQCSPNTCFVVGLAKG